MIKVEQGSSLEYAPTRGDAYIFSRPGDTLVFFLARDCGKTLFQGVASEYEAKNSIPRMPKRIRPDEFCRTNN